MAAYIRLKTAAMKSIIVTFVNVSSVIIGWAIIYVVVLITMRKIYFKAAQSSLAVVS